MNRARQLVALSHRVLDEANAITPGQNDRLRDIATALRRMAQEMTAESRDPQAQTYVCMLCHSNARFDRLVGIPDPELGVGAEFTCFGPMHHVFQTNIPVEEGQRLVADKSLSEEFA